MIELRHLRYFVAVAEELHFGRAAQRLHIAQPALSRQVQRLEEEVGTLLIKRTQRSVVLTAAGTAYLEHARHVLDEVMRAGTEAVRIANGEIGALRVTFIHSSTYNLTPTTLGIFTKRHPQISLNLREMTVIGQVEALARGDVDVALLRPPIKNKVLEWETVMQESFVVAVPERHLLAAEETVSIQDLRDEPFIMFTSHQSPLFHSRILSLCDAAGFIPRVTQEAIQIHTVLGLVGAGLGIALVPEAALHLFMPRVRFIELEEHMEPVDVALAWRRDNPNPAVPLFRAAVLDAARLIMSQRASTRAPGFTNRLPRE